MAENSAKCNRWKTDRKNPVKFGKKTEREKKEDRSTYCVTTKWFSAAQQLIESEINCVFLCSLLAATQWMILFFRQSTKVKSRKPSLFIFFVVWKLTSITPLCRSVLSFDTSVQCLVWLPRNRNLVFILSLNFSGGRHSILLAILVIHTRFFHQIVI